MYVQYIINIKLYELTNNNCNIHVYNINICLIVVFVVFIFKCFITYSAAGHSVFRGMRRAFIRPVYSQWNQTIQMDQISGKIILYYYSP